jgi:hypothetical protein
MNITDETKRAVYKKVFGQEYDDPKRRQHPLPLDIAFEVALHGIIQEDTEIVRKNKTQK